MTSTQIVARRRAGRQFAPNQPDGRTWIAPNVDEIFARLWRRTPTEPDMVNGRARISLADGEAAA